MTIVGIIETQECPEVPYKCMWTFDMDMYISRRQSIFGIYRYIWLLKHHYVELL